MVLERSDSASSAGSRGGWTRPKMARPTKRVEPRMFYHNRICDPAQLRPQAHAERPASSMSLRRPPFTPLPEPSNTRLLRSEPSILRAASDKSGPVARAPAFSFGSKSRIGWDGCPAASPRWRKATPGPQSYDAGASVKSLTRKPGKTIAPRGTGTLYTSETPGPGPVYKPQRLAAWQERGAKGPLKESPAYTLGGRSTLGVAWDAATMQVKDATPGPAAYRPVPTESFKAALPKWSMTGRAKEGGGARPQGPTPGPGDYAHAPHTRPASTFTLTSKPEPNPVAGGYLRPTSAFAPGPGEYRPRHSEKGHPYECRSTPMRAPGGGQAFSFGHGERLPDKPPATSVNISPGPAQYFPPGPALGNSLAALLARPASAPLPDSVDFALPSGVLEQPPPGPPEEEEEED